MEKDSRSRKWLITINNPKEKGFTHERIEDELKQFASLLYWCMADEVGDEGTYHTHVFVALENATRFSKLKKHFPGAHFDMANGTSAQNRDYVFKQGKWVKDKKAETNLQDTHKEYGEMPIERQGQRNDIFDLYAMIKEGISDYELLELNPEYMNKMDKIERARQIIRNQKFKGVFRELNVEYVFGTTGTGKTRGIMELYGYENVYRVTDYHHPFDNYNGQDVVIFEEFRSSLKIQDMLNFLDGYPLDLPCRYNNKVACYTKVYIITNIPLEAQYVTVQSDYGETWEAFLRRINKVKEFTPGVVHEYQSLQEYFNREYLKEAMTLFDKGGLDG